MQKQVQYRQSLQKSLQAEKAKNVLFREKVSEATEKSQLEITLENMLAELEQGKENFDAAKLLEKSELPALLIGPKLHIESRNKSANELLNLGRSKKKFELTQFIEGVSADELENFEKELTTGAIQEKELELRGLDQENSQRLKLLSIPVFTDSEGARAIIFIEVLGK